MLPCCKVSKTDMSCTREEIVANACRIHGEQIAWQDKAMFQEDLRQGTHQ